MTIKNNQIEFKASHRFPQTKGARDWFSRPQTDIYNWRKWNAEISYGCSLFNHLQAMSTLCVEDMIRNGYCIKPVLSIDINCLLHVKFAVAVCCMDMKITQKKLLYIRPPSFYSQILPIVGIISSIKWKGFLKSPSQSSFLLLYSLYNTFIVLRVYYSFINGNVAIR